MHRDPALADALERLAAEGPAPFYTGDVAAAVCDWVAERGGLLTRADLAAYATVARAPVRVAYRGQTVLTNPPPSAGGILLAYALALLDRAPAPPSVAAIVDAMEAAQAERTPEFLAGLADPGFLERFSASRLGATTHISAVDADGWACAVTCTNGEGCGEVVPGTGIHLNNMMGEQDLSPFGFHAHPPGRRLPSMMAPTMVLGDGGPRLVLGSAGLEPDPLGDPAGGDRRARPRARRAGGDRRAARALRGRRRLRRAGRRHDRAGGRRSARSSASRRATCSSAAPRRCCAIPARAR